MAKTLAPLAPRQRLGKMLFLLAAALSFALSVTLWFVGYRAEALFVGLWVPSILAGASFWMTALRQP